MQSRLRIARYIAAAALMAVMSATAGAAPEVDRYGGWPAIAGAKTGFFGVQKMRDRWWFTTPEGSAFLSRGIDVIDLASDETPTQVRRRMAKWGFNTAGPGSLPQVRGDGIAYTAALNLSAPTIEAGARPPGRDFPDVFDPRFERIANEIAGNVCPLHADDPWLLGYYTDEGLEWRAKDDAAGGSAGGARGGEDLMAAYFAMPTEAAGKRALVAEIKRLYADDVGAFARAWGLPVKSFDDLLAMRELKPGARYKGFTVSRDRSALLQLIAARYFEVTSAAIRAHDAKHLLLGCRFARPPGCEALAAMRGRMDVASIADGPELSPDVLTQMHNDSGLPLLVAPLVIEVPRGAAAPRQDASRSSAQPPGPKEALADAQGREYAARVERLAKQAFVVGYAWPRYGRGQATDETCALTDSDGEGNALLVAAIAKTNADFYEHASMARLKPTIFEVVGRYELRRAAEGGIRVDGDLKDWASAAPMELRPSAYERDSTGIEASAYLMWDTGAVYVAGQLYDDSVAKSTVTAYVGADWVELGAAGYCFYVTLQPGAQTVTDGKGKTRPADLVVGRVYARGEGPIPAGGAGASARGGAAASAAGGRRIAGYAFEARVNVPAPIPEGFIFHFGLALHHYTKDRREVRLSFPYYWSGPNPASCGECIVAGRGQ